MGRKPRSTDEKKTMADQIKEIAGKKAKVQTYLDSVAKHSKMFTQFAWTAKHGCAKCKYIGSTCCKPEKMEARLQTQKDFAE